MIRWCSYCQNFLGEAPPYDMPVFTHGICDTCDARLEADEPMKENTEAVRALFRRVLEAAANADEQACVPLMSEARRLGLPADALLVGLLQPALYEIGRGWEAGRISVEAEHRFTDWCQRVFSHLAQAPGRSPHTDVLILQPPGNLHTVGPRFAAAALEARGLQVEVIASPLPLEAMVAVARQLKPRFIGFSCALPSAVPVAVELIRRIRDRLEPALGARYVLSGLAFRLTDGAPEVEAGIEVVRDLEFFTPRRLAE